jgi:two-component system, OmpR family, sensor histidine kinase QseC
MTLQRRLLLIVLIGAPVVWLLALAIGAWSARKEINELFDTQQVRMAQQLAALLDSMPPAPGGDEGVRPEPAGGGDAELGDMSVAVWDRAGNLKFSDAEGPRLVFRAGATGFVEIGAERDRWRVYYDTLALTGGTVAVGQAVKEREELIQGLMLGQVGPWLLMLALLLPVLYFGIRRTMAPVVSLARGIETRPSSDLSPLPSEDLPGELRPLVEALNRLFGRILESIEHDRRFTADAAHELRTPLAATRAQWEVASQTADPQQRAEAGANVARGLDRMSRLVSQLLALARLDSVWTVDFTSRIDWRDLIAQTVPDVLALADSRATDIDVQWRVDAEAVLPVLGNPELLSVALRNLLDNAVRYGAGGSQVEIVLDAGSISVLDRGPGVPPDMLARLGDRFFRAGGQVTIGSGLGLSIAGRIARLHGLQLSLANRAGGGFCAALRRGEDLPERLLPGRLQL